MLRLVPYTALAVGIGCSTSIAPAGSDRLSALPRELSANEQMVAHATNHFAFQLFKQLNVAEPDSNIFVSPVSVSFSLGMAMNGAGGTTLDDIRSGLGFGAVGLREINDGYSSIMTLEQGLDPLMTFAIANSVWYRQALSVRQSFVDVVGQAFKADVRSATFDAGSIALINEWVSRKTNNRISAIVTHLDSSEAMILVNATYFKGSWRQPFDKTKTAMWPFQSLNGPQSVATMMSEPREMRLGATTTHTIAELEYGNSSFVMNILSPAKSHSVEEIISGLDTASWESTVRGLREGRASVHLPKLRLEYDRELVSALEALGMRAPFIPGAANFEAMSTSGRELHINFVQSKTFATIDEEGTEAAGVAGTGMEWTSAPGCFCIDRPFVILIRERFSGTILFIGKVVRIP